MEKTQLILIFLWIALMLVYLLGDVLRIFSGDFKDGQMVGEKFKFTQKMWLGISILMVIPIVMIVLTAILDQSVNKIANIAVAVFFFLFNLVALPSYPSAYDRFLIVVGLVFNLITISYAWNWV